MKPYFLGTDGKPCIWPVPSECLWTTERYRLKSSLRIFAADGFGREAALFAESLKDSYRVISVQDMSLADIRVLRCADSELGAEGYYLETGESGAEIRAISAPGVFYGLQSLYQLIVNSPDPSIHGVRVTDKPFKAFRGVCIELPGPDEAESFKRFADFIARYKFNKIAFKTDMSHESESMHEASGNAEMSGITEYLSDRHKVVFGYEWKNPYPERRIAEITLSHEPGKKGGIVLLAATGVI